MSDRTPVRSLASRQVLADQAYSELMGALVAGEIEADQPLNIDGLAREMDISPTPIREALARLEATGLVRRTALKGYRVAPLFSVDEVSELMEARQLLEPENAFLACTKSTKVLVEDLHSTIEQLQESLVESGAGAIKPYWQADERFHRLIAEGAGNRFLLSAYTALGGHVQRFRLFGGLGVSDAEPAIREHTRILEAFKAGDPTAARFQMSEHIASVRSRAIADMERIEHPA